MKFEWVGWHTLTRKQWGIGKLLFPLYQILQTGGRETPCIFFLGQLFMAITLSFLVLFPSYYAVPYNKGGHESIPAFLMLEKPSGLAISWSPLMTEEPQSTP